MRRIIEPLKSIIIIFLVVSMLVMSSLLMSFDMFSTGTGNVDKSASSFFKGLGLPFLSKYFEEKHQWQETVFSASRLLYPNSIAYIKDQEIKGIFYDEERLLSSFESLSPTVSALVLQGKSESFNEDIKDKLTKDGILVNMGRNMSLNLFCRITSNKISSVTGISFNHFFITADSTNTYLYLTNIKDNKLVEFSLPNSQIPTPLTALMETINSDSLLPALLSHSLADSKLGISSVSGYIFPKDAVTVFSLLKSNPIYIEAISNYNSANMSYIIGMFNLNSGSINREVTADGSIIYVENLSNITLAKDGMVRYSAFHKNGGIPLVNYIGPSGQNGYTQQEIIAAAQKFLDSFDSSILGGDSANLRLSDAYYDVKDSTFNIEFDYVVDGIPVHLQNNIPAVTIKYSNGYFKQIEIKFENFTKSTTPHLVLGVQESMHFFSARYPATLENLEMAYPEGENSEILPQFLFYWS